MSSREIDLSIILQWKELGFHYLLNDAEMTWIIRGDHAGLRKFAGDLRLYANNPANHVIGEHEHFGPYFYLKIITASSAAVTDSAWMGRPEDFLKLAGLIENHLNRPAQKSFIIAQDFAAETTFVIRFEIEDDSFDPSSADTEIVHRS